jgi:hypothetical protein
MVATYYNGETSSLFTVLWRLSRNKFANKQISVVLGKNSNVIISGNHGQFIGEFNYVQGETSFGFSDCSGKVHTEGSNYMSDTLVNLIANAIELWETLEKKEAEKTKELQDKLLMYSIGADVLISTKFKDHNMFFTSKAQTEINKQVFDIGFVGEDKLCSTITKIVNGSKYVSIIVKNSVVFSGLASPEEYLEELESLINRQIYKKAQLYTMTIDVVKNIIPIFSIKTEIVNGSLLIKEQNLFESESNTICTIGMENGAYALYLENGPRYFHTDEDLEKGLTKVLKIYFEMADTKIDICDSDLLKVSKVAAANGCNLKDALSILLNK